MIFIRKVVHGLDAPEGFRTISYCPRGSATLVSEQLDRLLDGHQGKPEFGTKEIHLTPALIGAKAASHARYLTEGITISASNPFR